MINCFGGAIKMLAKKNKTFLFLLLFCLLFSYGNVVIANDSNYEQQAQDYQSQGLEFDFKSTEINEAFRLLANATEMNIATTDSVSGELSITLNGVSFFEAIEIITRQEGLTYTIFQDTVIIGEADELVTRFEEKETRIYHLRNAEPEEIKDEIAHLVTQGEIKLNQRMNSIMITSHESILREVEDLIPRLDQARRQVSIKVRFQEVAREEMDDLGIDWSFGEISVLGVGELEVGDFDLRYPEMELDYQSFLEFLESESSSEMLANPRITTVEGEEATLHIGDTIPVVRNRSFDEQGNEVVEIADEEVGIDLSVLPRITEDNRILIDLEPEVTNITGMTTVAGSSHPETSVKNIKTQVEVEDGNTLVMGGLVQSFEETTKSQLPFLGSVPFLGRLFTNESTEIEERELIMFITPEIISNHDYDFGYESFSQTRVYNYQIEEGQDFSEVAELFNLSYVEIMQENKNVSREELFSEQEIQIPAPEDRFYEVQAGEDYDSIADEFDISVSDLKVMNNYQEIEENSVIILPINAETATDNNNLEEQIDLDQDTD